jgi:DnaK suppressor protein
MTAISAPGYLHLERVLRSRLEDLRIEIRNTLLRTDADRYAVIAEQVHDFKDQALSALLTSVGHAEIARDLNEVRDIETALERMALKQYGECIQCGAHIPSERLWAYPSAKRCLPCQQRHESGPGRNSASRPS